MDAINQDRLNSYKDKPVNPALQPLYEAYQKKMDMTIGEWLTYYQNRLANESKWMGITAVKNPIDAWIYQEIIFEVKPDYVIEIGSYRGGSTTYLANMLKLLGNDGTVISIDINRDGYEATEENIKPLTGSSQDSGIIDYVKSCCKDKKALVIHDGYHGGEHVYQDLKAYSEIVSIGSYLIVEDTILDMFKRENFWAAIEEGPYSGATRFLSEDDRFVVDSSKERHMITHNFNGYLKRIK